MTNGKLNQSKVKLTCIVLALVLLFGCAQVIAAELGNYAFAMAQAAEGSEQNATNDLTSGEEELFLPNYDTEVITKKNLRKPRVKTFGDHEASYYPSFTNQIADFDDAKKAEILKENRKIIADTEAMFNDGTLKDKLQKHVSADGQFSNAAGNYDKAKRIEKVVTINSTIAARKRSLGMFAPGGEVITVTIDESLVDKGLTVNIGYPYKAECDIGDVTDRWKNDRMPLFFLEFKLTQTVTYIGSPLGGMITLNGVNSNLGSFDIKLSGGVDMPDYKLGVSTKEDWQRILAAPGPYVWLLTPYQYFVMPKTEIADIEDPYNAMMWWHKVSMISMYSMAREDTGHFMTPVISVYDSYVYIGEGVAKVWAFVTNAPKYWCHGIVDYDSIMSGGSWGAIHEYNHHHQSHAYNSVEWGVGGKTEVTNNVVNAISYILLTDIAATRSESNLLNGWGAVADPYCNYNKLKNGANGKADYDKLDSNKLFGYVDMMHTFGADRFSDFLRAQYGYGAPVEGYTGQNLNQSDYLTTQDGFTLFASLYYKTDFTDYFTKVWHFSLSDGIINQIKGYGFDEYYSVNNLYSVGIKGIETGRPYKVSGKDATVFDFAKYTLCSADSYTLQSVSEPKHGTLNKNADGTYTYTPSKGFVEDSFELTYKVTLNGKTYERTLVVKLTSDEATKATNVYPALVDLRNGYIRKWYTDVVTTAPVEVKCLDNDGNEVKTVKDADPMAMFDGNTSTGFHTAWQGSTTAYPHNYYFTFAEDALFNRINFTFGDNGIKGYYAIGEYEIYTSKDGVNYELLKQGKNTETHFNVLFDTTVTTKYVKLVVKSNSGGQRFTNITEMQFAQGVDMGDAYKLYTSKSSKLHYDSKARWTDLSGNYMNSQARHTKQGKFKFYLNGTDLILYSTNATSKIKIDGVTYTIKANDKNYSASFVVSGLSEGKHLVVIEGKDMNFDMIQTSGTITYAKGAFVEWGGMAAAIVLGVGLIATLTTFFVLETKRKKSEETSN